MPVMDGFDFVCSARANPANRDMRIMMVTTETEHTQVLTRALEAGASEYLMKPFAPEALADKLAILELEGRLMAAIRVLIVDDSVVVRKVLTETLSGAPDIEVVGAAATGFDRAPEDPRRPTPTS